MVALDGNSLNGKRKCKPFEAKAAPKIAGDKERRRDTRRRREDYEMVFELGIGIDDLRNGKLTNALTK